MNLTWREAAEGDFDLLAEWNHQLIGDIGHRNPMNLEQLTDRMRMFLQEGYRAIIFSDGEPAGYALFRREPELLYLRQFFVRRDRRRLGIGRAAFALLRTEVWPKEVRLTVEALSRDDRAISFWRSVGYRDYSITLEILP